MTKQTENLIVHLPIADNDGNSLRELNAEFIHRLVTIFGGCTTMDFKGIWHDADGKQYIDHGVRVIISHDGSRLSSYGIQALIASYCRDAKQMCVYAVIDGIVEFISPVLHNRISYPKS